MDPQTEKKKHFKELLDEHHDWPGNYTFKFIVAKDRVERVLDLFEERDDITTRPSRHGRYISVTANCEVSSSEEVIAVYEAAASIEGIIPL
jgi:hypothetical protein